MLQEFANTSSCAASQYGCALGTLSLNGNKKHRHLNGGEVSTLRICTVQRYLQSCVCVYMIYTSCNTLHFLRQWRQRADLGLRRALGRRRRLRQTNASQEEAIDLWLEMFEGTAARVLSIFYVPG